MKCIEVGSTELIQALRRAKPVDIDVELRRRGAALEARRRLAKGLPAGFGPEVEGATQIQPGIYVCNVSKSIFAPKTTYAVDGADNSNQGEQ